MLAPTTGTHRCALRAARSVLLLIAAFWGGVLAFAPGAPAHDGHDHAAGAAAASATAAGSSTDSLAEEPVIPGLDVAVDFQVAPSGDVYVAHQNGRIVRYKRAAGSTSAHPSYNLQGELIYDFPVTRQFDRGLVGIALDSQFENGQRYLYAVITRGSNEWVSNVQGGNPNGIRRTGAVIRIAVPASGPATASNLKTIVGADAPADPDSTCKPYTQGQAPAGESDAFPNGVLLRTDSLYANLNDNHVYPDGDLATRADGAYDCLPSDSSTHGMGAIASAPDGTLFFSIGDASDFEISDPASLRAFNLESYAGKIMRVDREGRGVAGHPFCPAETDLTRICTKVWVRGMRNPFRFNLLPPDGASNGAPVLAIGDVGNFSFERLTIAHPGDNLGWPCWEGTYWAVAYASPERATAVKSAWGGPELTPAGPGKTSCERLTATGTGTGFPTAKGVKLPTIEYEHDQQSDPPYPYNGAAVVAGGLLTATPGADAEVALPSEWQGSYVFGDYVRGWLYRVGRDADDPSNADLDGGLRVPADENRSPNIQTDAGPGRPVDGLLDRVGDAPPKVTVVVNGETQLLSQFYRLTSRPQADGTVWSMHYGDANVGGLYRIRSAPEVEATIESVSGACAAAGQTQGNVVLTAADAGAGAVYRWDIDGDGLSDAGRTARTTTVTAAQLPAQGWVRLIVTRGSSRAVAARYLCSGPPPNVDIVSPADETKVVLGKPVVVRASRPAGDADATKIPDSELKWRATTVHGSSHEHPLVEKQPPFETVDGQQRMQVTVTPDPSHELGSYTRVRIIAPGSDSSTVTRTIKLLPKPVTVELRSAPAGARVAVRRDLGESAVGAAPGTIELAAGFSTQLSAAETWTDSAGTTWYFARWSDGQTSAARGWVVPDNGGAAPTAEYDTKPAPPKPTTPEPTSPTTPEPTTPAPTAPQPTTGGKLEPPVVRRALPPTALELSTAPLVTSSASTKRTTTIKASLGLGRPIDATGLVVKIAMRDTICRWWVFAKGRFSGGAVRSRASKRACAEPPSWKLATSSWSATGQLTINQELVRRLPPGRYALRVRVSRGQAVLTDRLRSVTVR